jgi:hypothetical protein
VRRLALPALGRRVLTRLGQRTASARSLAIAVAVLGEGTTTAGASAGRTAGAALLSGICGCVPGAALEVLQDEGVLIAHERTWSAPPLLARSILAALRPSELSRWHRKAAGVLEAADAPFEEIAAHLARSMPAADRAVVGRLRLGAHRARQVGDVATGAGYLRRAFEEGVREFECDLALELAAVRSRENVADAIVLLERASALTHHPVQRAALGWRLDSLARELLGCAQG